MAGFAVCADCAREYHDPDNRRFHAEPISCPACGPRLSLRNSAGRMLDGDPVREAAALLAAGAVIAIKGLGGYHLAAAAEHATAVAALRGRKHREDKPFAVMMPTLAAAHALAVRAGDLLLLNKIDLLPHLQFDLQRCLEYVRRVNPRLRVVPISAQRGDGLETWYMWLRARMTAPATRADMR